MDHATRVCGRESFGELPRDARSHVRRHRAVAIEAAVETFAVDVIHADQPLPVVLGKVVDAHHARARHLPRHQQFLAEPFERIGARGELGTQQLQRDRNIQGEIRGAIHHAHAADADHGFDTETPGENGAGRELLLGVKAGGGRCCHGEAPGTVSAWLPAIVCQRGASSIERIARRASR